MKSSKFAYVAPETREELLQELARLGDQATLLAGGQSLIPLMRLGLAQPEIVVSLGSVAGMDTIQVRGDMVEIGAGVTIAGAMASAAVREHLPGLVDAETLIAHPSIRARGTVCGNLAHADPSSELPAIALASGARMVLSRQAGEREVLASDFYLAPLTTMREPDEVLSAVRFPIEVGHRGAAIEEAARRHGDFALAGAYACVRIDSEGICMSAVVSAFAVASTPIVMTSVANALIGRGRESIVEASALAGEGLSPRDDIHASGAYRLAALRTLTRRAVSRAWDIAASERG